MGRDLRWCGKHSGPGHFADCTLPVNDAAQGGPLRWRPPMLLGPATTQCLRP
ncbi:MAG: hypothetical protein WC934_11195 [Acidithiobacillus sp.]